MEISEIEYLEMKNQIDQLKAKVDSLGGVRNIREMIECLPHEFIKNIEDDVPIFAPCDGSGDTWLLFTKLAKILHTQDWSFYMDTAGEQFYKRPYIRTIGKRPAPTKISQMESEQVALSVEMLNEMIPIYNKYFRRAHEFVLYKPNVLSDFQSVKVTYKEDIE